MHPHAAREQGNQLAPCTPMPGRQPLQSVHRIRIWIKQVSHVQDGSPAPQGFAYNLVNMALMGK